MTKMRYMVLRPRSLVPNSWSQSVCWMLRKCTSYDTSLMGRTPYSSLQLYSTANQKRGRTPCLMGTNTVDVSVLWSQLLKASATLAGKSGALTSSYTR